MNEASVWRDHRLIALVNALEKSWWKTRTLLLSLRYALRSLLTLYTSLRLEQAGNKQSAKGVLNMIFGFESVSLRYSSQRASLFAIYATRLCWPFRAVPSSGCARFSHTTWMQRLELAGVAAELWRPLSVCFFDRGNQELKSAYPTSE